MIETKPADRTANFRAEWYRSLAAFEKPEAKQAVRQLLDTFVPYLALMGLMFFLVSRGYSYLYTLALAPIAAGLLVRVFIIFHDCCHGSFAPSRAVNRTLGYFAGLLVFTPFEHWRHYHAQHHATAGDLDRRGAGDIWVMTVEEFRAASPLQKFFYRFYRHPLVLFFIGPPYLFIIGQRFPLRGESPRERRSVMMTNLGLAVILLLAHFTIGLKTYLLVQLPVMFVASTAGVWLFYVQHQFGGVYWERHEHWDPMEVALHGSSFYRLPPLLQWFSGNIGFHHIHHLRPRIPNYHLPRAYAAVPELQNIEPLTFAESLRSISMNLWDESARTLVSFRAAASNARS